MPDGRPNCFIANKFDFNVDSGAIICMARRLHSQEYVRENLLHWIISFGIFFSHQNIYWADNKKHFFKMNFAENFYPETISKSKNTVAYPWLIGNLFFTFMIILIFNLKYVAISEEPVFWVIIIIFDNLLISKAWDFFQSMEYKQILLCKFLLT